MKRKTGLTLEVRQIISKVKQIWRLRQRIKELDKKINYLENPVRDYVLENPIAFTEKGNPIWREDNVEVILSPTIRYIVDPKNFIAKVGLEQAIHFLAVNKEGAINAIKTGLLKGITEKELEEITEIKRLPTPLKIQIKILK